MLHGEDPAWQRQYRDNTYRAQLVANPVGAFLNRWVMFELLKDPKRRGNWPERPLYCCESELWSEIEVTHDDDCPARGLE